MRSSRCARRTRASGSTSSSGIRAEVNRTLACSVRRSSTTTACRRRFVFAHCRTSTSCEPSPGSRVASSGISCERTTSPGRGSWRGAQPAERFALHHTRNAAVAFCLTRAGLPTVLEVHSPPTGQRTKLIRRMGARPSLRGVVALTDRLPRTARWPSAFPTRRSSCSGVASTSTPTPSSRPAPSAGPHSGYPMTDKSSAT